MPRSALLPGVVNRLARFAGPAVSGVVALLALATLAGFLDAFSWVFEGATVFRLQYAGAAAAAALLALPLRRFRIAAAAVALVLVNLAAVAPWHGSDNPPVPAGAPTLRILSFNVDGANRRYDELRPLLARFDPDIVGLTELTPAWAEAAATASSRLRPRRLEPESGVYGLGLLSRTAPAGIEVERFPAGTGPLTLVARFTVSGRAVTFVLVHVHTPFAGSIHARELRALARARPRLGPRVIVCGDFNAVPWSAQLGDFAEEMGLRDSYQGSWPAYSWPSWSALLRVPLDHCLVSAGVAVVHHRFGPSVGSDHFPLIVDLALVPLG